MKIPNSNCGKTAAFTFNNGIHFARNLSQDTFQCMENQQNNMLNTVLLYFDNLPLKLT